MKTIGLILMSRGVLFFSSSAMANVLASITDYDTGQVAVIDTSTNSLVTNSLGVGQFPWSVAVGGNDRAYFYSADSITEVDAAALQAIPPTLGLPNCTSDSVPALNPDATFLYVGCNPNGLLKAIDLQAPSMAVTDTLTMPGAVFRDIIVDGSGARLLVADSGSDEVNVLDITSSSMTVDASLPAGALSGTNGIDLDASNNLLYVPSGSPPNQLVVIDPIASSVVATLAASGWHVAVDPEPSSSAYQLAFNGEVTEIDTSNQMVSGPVSTGAGFYFSSAVHPTDGRVYLLNTQFSQVEVYDPASWLLFDTIGLPGFIEPRLVGRWMAQGLAATPSPAIGVPLFGQAPWALLVFALFAFLLAWPVLRRH